MSKEVIKLSDIFNATSEDFEVPLMGEKFLNKDFLLISIEIKRSSLGVLAIVGTNKGLCRTSSTVVIEQLKQLKDLMVQQNVEISVKLVEIESESGLTYQTLV